MSAGDDFGDDTPFGEFAQQLMDDSGVDLRERLSTEQMEQLNDQMEEQRHQRENDENSHPGGAQNSHEPPDPLAGGMQDGQTIHDAAHWMGEAVGGAGEMVGNVFVPSDDSESVGIIEDDVKPMEHRVITEENGDITASWVDDSANISIADHQYEKNNETEDGTYFYYNDDSAASDDAYDSAFEDGFQEGQDEANAAAEDENYYSE
jgi:hypothetical protein